MREDTISETALEALRTEDLKEVLRRTEILLSDLCGTDVSVLLYDSKMIAGEIKKGGLLSVSLSSKKPLICNDVTSDGRYKAEVDNFKDLDIGAVLFYPLVEENELKGILICWGKKAYDTIEESMEPLRSGQQTIGVTIKKKKIHHEAIEFDRKSIDLLDQAMPKILEIFENREQSKELLNVSSKTSGEATENKQQEKNKSVDIKSKTSLIDKIKGFFRV